MPNTSASRIDVLPALAFVADAKSDWIALIQAQQHFADLPGLTAAAFQQGPDFPEARKELFRTFLWLKALLPGDGDVALVRAAIEAEARRQNEHAGALTPEQFDLYGQGKRDLLLLCEALHQDQRPSTVAAACRELRLAFDGSGGVPVPPAGVIAGTLSCVQVESSASTRRRWVPCNSMTSSVPLPSAPMSGTLASSEATDDRARNSPDQRLVDGTDRLARLARQHGLEPTQSLEHFLARFLGAMPHGGQNDPVGNLHLFGLDALQAVVDAAAGPGKAWPALRTALRFLIDALGKTDDPAGAILLARNELSAKAVLGLSWATLDRIRGDVVDRAVQSRGAALLAQEGLPREDLDRLLHNEAMAVKNQLGIVGGIDSGAESSGLFDTSSSSLAELLKTCDGAVEAALSKGARGR